MFTFKEVIKPSLGVTEIRLETWVKRGWVSPAQSKNGYLFSELDVARCELIRQFRDDLEIDSETIPVLLSLIDQLHGLRRELRTVMKAIDNQPQDIRNQILKTLKEQKYRLQD